jgi:hypothetical protein
MLYLFSIFVLIIIIAPQLSTWECVCFPYMSGCRWLWTSNEWDERVLYNLWRFCTITWQQPCWMTGTIRYIYMRMNSIPQGKEIQHVCLHVILQNIYWLYEVNLFANRAAILIYGIPRGKSLSFYHEKLQKCFFKHLIVRNIKRHLGSNKIQYNG